MSPSPRLPPLRGCSIRQRAFRRACRMGPKRRIVTKQRRAIGTDDLACIAHVEKHVRVIERSQLALAHELPRADLDDRDARRVVEVRNNPLRHVLKSAFDVTELTRRAAARHHSQPGWPWLGQSFSSANRPQSKCRGGLHVPSRGQSAIFRHGPLPAPPRLAKLRAGAQENDSVTAARIAVPLALAVAFAFAAAPRAFEAQFLLAAQDDPAALADHAVARAFDADAAAREIDAALAADDADLAISFLDLARERNLPIHPALAEKVERANAGIATAART